MSVTILLEISDLNNRWNKLALKESRKEHFVIELAGARAEDNAHTSSSKPSGRLTEEHDKRVRG